MSVEHLVILGSTLTGLAIARHSRGLGISCDIVDTNFGPGSNSNIPIRNLLISEPEADLVRTILSLGGEKRSAIIADSDRWLRWISSNRGELEATYECILHSSNEVLELCLDKTRFMQWCAENSISAPKHYSTDFSRLTLNVSYPVLVRPEQTQHGAGSGLPKAQEIDCEEDLLVLLESFASKNVKATVSESLLRPGIRQFSVGVASDKDRNLLAIVCEKIRPLADRCAGGTFVTTSPDVHVQDFAINAVKRIGLFGIAEVEVLKDEDSGELFLIEINPRPWVQYSLSWNSGIDLLSFILGVENPRMKENRAPKNRGWINVADDLYVVFSRSEGMLRRREISLGEYFQTLLGARLFSLWNWRDPRPWFSWLLDRLKSPKH